MQLELLDTLESVRRGEACGRSRLGEVLYSLVQDRVERRLSSGQDAYASALLGACSREDLVQEVVLRGLVGLAQFSGQSLQTLGKFTDVLTENTLLDLWRYQRAARRRIWFEGWESLRRIPSDGEFDSPMATAAHREELGICQRAIDSFESRERALLRARIQESRSFDDIAQETGFGTADAARKACYVAQEKLVLRARALGLAV